MILDGLRLGLRGTRPFYQVTADALIPVRSEPVAVYNVLVVVQLAEKIRTGCGDSAVERRCARRF